MSVEIWPSLPPEQLKVAVDQTQRRELEWLLNELHETLQTLKSGLQDCYALLAPVDPGSTLVVSTPRNEIVKGHVTRVGTRIVKGTLALRLRTHPHQTYTISPDSPIHLAPLTNLHALLNHSIELLALTITHTSPPVANTPISPPPSPTLSTATFIAAQLFLLSQSLTEASSLLKGPQPLTASDATWVSKSCSPTHFSPLPTRDLSVCWGVQDSCLVLWLRCLEPADAPVSVGMKFALALGTARRLEHDEADQVFVYTYPEGSEAAPARPGTSAGNNEGKASEATGNNGQLQGKGNKESDRGDEVQVYVREKVRIESADPSLLSLSSKLMALTNTLALARANLAAVMGEDFDE
ncbi:hypothetical protein N0V93_009494 [Gnomoniopsis smithogilvyi]|uniref:RAVE subunit 2/Rogdi n=1 Tax=Gnomoniopsis smithogilvyi TaxID=1191159 RepID=A0A9W8YL67_9PEZI|nr:hypothetical protein N0V93_009494 [Gnomoniopsis smithogilvyi]